MARSPGTKAAAAPAADPRTTILDGFLVLLAQKPFERISLGEVATQAGVTLAELRASFGSTFDMLSAFLRETDRKVLAGAGEDMDGESARDRLFDVLMRRLDALAPHKAAIRSLAESARRNPFFALALNRLSVRSQQWMLAAAKIDTAGARGAVRAQGLALLFARVMQTFLADDEPDLARTMAALDRELARGERMLGFVEGAARLARCAGRRRPKPAAAPASPPDAPAMA
ncbi:TetR/AcrR family transcriptional regulator [Ancylobacter sp. TS-1]|uniref:TetR/AcrR family transcriptional regulator n=1 Tax=Ancylobacter sp. TS-1 TaxID=1850374 RepID=UPI001265CE9D|nr:TetR/AcrR family transcriptional regulator [Ancylobacter sp. TS-1]QFR32903.1 TetR/AcrR family transcriptional regulator [Ancylobacter sp. TS-1]